MTSNNLIDRYVHEIGRHLPKKLREDVKLEIRSALEDMLEERGIDAERDSSQIEALLIEYGEPEKVAASYQPEKWLIGPKLYPAFELAIKIALGVVAAVTLLGFSISSINDGFSFELVGRFIGNVSGALFNALGVVVLVFFILERLGAGEEKETELWQPQSLPKVEDPNQFSRNEMIISILFSVAALIIMNYFPHWVGIYGSHNGEWTVIARLAPEFSVHIPWLSALWALEIALRVEALRSGAWNKASRYAEFALSAFGIFILYRILTGGPILTLAVLTFLVKGALLIALVVSVIELIGQAYRLILSLLSEQKTIVAGLQ